MRDPLWELQKALYTRLTGSSIGATVYDWLPDAPSYPYVLMEDEESDEGAATKSDVLAKCGVTLLAVSDRKDGQELKEIIDAIATSMETRLVIADSWAVINQKRRPRTRTFRAQMNDGRQGRAARIVFSFDIKDQS